MFFGHKNLLVVLITFALPLNNQENLSAAFLIVLLPVRYQWVQIICLTIFVYEYIELQYMFVQSLSQKFVAPKLL